ncbi:6-carboxytetrahydropterin synthase, partial [Burkholderia pseudomallei]
TRILELDSGQRIPVHRSQCRHLQGHSYVLEITLRGDLVETEGAPDRGIVMDFADVNALAMEHLVSKWDHAILDNASDEIV